MTVVEEAKALLAEGYFQTSSRYCMLAKLPEGKTGQEALYEASVKEYVGGPHEAYWRREQLRWAFSMSNDHAADQYLRVYAPEELRKSVHPTVMKAFRQLGGRTATG